MSKNKAKADKFLIQAQNVLSGIGEVYGRLNREETIYPVLEQAAERLSEEVKDAIRAASTEKIIEETRARKNRVDGNYLVKCFNDTFGHVTAYRIYWPSRQGEEGFKDSYRLAFMAAHAVRVSVENYNSIARFVPQREGDLLGVDFTKAADEIEGYTKQAMQAWGMSAEHIDKAQCAAVEEMNQRKSVSFIGAFHKG